MLVMTSFFAFDIVPYANMHVKIQNSQGLPASHCEKRELPGAACLCVWMNVKVGSTALYLYTQAHTHTNINDLWNRTFPFPR